MNDPSFKRKHKQVSNLQSFILAICGQNSELFLKGFDACIKNSLIVEDWISTSEPRVGSVEDLASLE